MLKVISTLVIPGQVSCLSCTAGYKCQNGGITKCPKGTFSAEGAKTCSSCDSGYYSDQKGKMGIIWSADFIKFWSTFYVYQCAQGISLFEYLTGNFRSFYKQCPR